MASSKAIINTILALRILTFLLCAASLALIVLTMLRGSIKSEFHGIKSYRYVLGAAAGGILYSLIQLPFAMYHAVIAFLLASGVGLGFGVSFEFKDIKRGETIYNKWSAAGWIYNYGYTYHSYFHEPQSKRLLVS
ncbi:hypothetical protein H5410_017977 [Solanum commersonii]|uniref:CASP-like protein n=1 Tax=Solanum commersonii TaxID=4109 RepID=A0A9J6A0S9_SOLCO|nr:hypothetical protein H5410_017977 [Solanum commersonii]